MKAYIYQGALLCEECALSYREQICCQGVTPNYEDSERWPVGPYSNGGGESNSPCHCDHCGVFLENPLTTDGYEYVREAVSDALTSPGWLGPTIASWTSFYGMEVS